MSITMDSFELVDGSDCLDHKNGEVIKKKHMPSRELAGQYAIKNGYLLFVETARTFYFKAKKEDYSCEHIKNNLEKNKGLPSYTNCKAYLIKNTFE